MCPGYIGGLVLEQLLRVGKISKVSQSQPCTMSACMCGRAADVTMHAGIPGHPHQAWRVTAETVEDYPAESCL